MKLFQVFSNGKLTHFIDGTFDSQNWLKAVNCARYKKEQNLAVLQEGSEVYYEAIRDIAPGEELLVWYGNGYEKFMDIPLCYNAVTTEKVLPDDMTGKWMKFHCKVCNRICVCKARSYICVLSVLKNGFG